MSRQNSFLAFVLHFADRDSAALLAARWRAVSPAIIQCNRSSRADHCSPSHTDIPIAANPATPLPSQVINITLKEDSAVIDAVRKGQAGSCHGHQ